MIHVERGRLDEHGREIRPSAGWFDDAKVATDELIKDPTKEITGLYRSSEVKVCLEELFHNKCAYCESKPTASSDWDVEHYRPKRKVKEAPTHPGYYWLAYTWDNLLLSCPHCNQARYDPPTYEDRSRGAEAHGKMDQFPLEDEAKRAMGPSEDCGRESPLLIDPTREDPAPLFFLSPLGELSEVAGSPKARETLRICHLNRRRLKEARVEKLALLKELVLLRRAAEGHPDLLARVEALLDRECAADAEYSAVARAVRRNPGAYV